MTRPTLRRSSLALAVAAPFLAAGAHAAPVPIDWSTIDAYTTDPVTGLTTATGSLDAGGTTVGVTYTGLATFVQSSGQGTNYWTEGSPAPYTGGTYDAGAGYVPGKALADAPGDNSLFALQHPTTMTITFSQPVANVYMGLVSWNGDGIANFSAPYSIVSSGVGYWGEGVFTNVTDTGFTGAGDLHGVIEFSGAISTLTFDVTGDEYWHGLLMGTEGLAPPPTADVPEPASWALTISGFALVGGALRGARRTAFA